MLFSQNPAKRPPQSPNSSLNIAQLTRMSVRIGRASGRVPDGITNLCCFAQSLERGFWASQKPPESDGHFLRGREPTLPLKHY
jgi:hypothetical protein